MNNFRPANEHLQELLAAEDVEMSIIISNPHLEDNPLIYVNEKFLVQTGYIAEEVVGKNCRFLQGPDTCPDVVRTISQALNAKMGIEADILNYRKDGTAFMNRVRIRPLFDQNNDLMYFLGAQSPV